MKNFNLREKKYLPTYFFLFCSHRKIRYIQLYILNILNKHDEKYLIGKYIYITKLILLMISS